MPLILPSLKWSFFWKSDADRRWLYHLRSPMRHFDPLSLRLFVAVCEERNIALAAQREAIVASAVSKRISQMEEATGDAACLNAADAVSW